MGRKTMKEINENDQCLKTIPRFLHSTLIYEASPKYPLTATLFANNTAIKHIFVRNMHRFQKLYKKKAFLHYYINNGTVEEYIDKDSSYTDVDEKDFYNEFMDNLGETQNF